VVFGRIGSVVGNQLSDLSYRFGCGQLSPAMQLYGQSDRCLAYSAADRRSGYENHFGISTHWQLLHLIRLVVATEKGICSPIGMNRFGRIKITLLLIVTAFCLSESVLSRQNDLFRQLEAAIPSIQPPMLFCQMVWLIALFCFKFSLNDLPLIGMVLITMAANLIDVRPNADAINFLTGVIMGKGTALLLGQESEIRRRKSEGGNTFHLNNRQPAVSNFLIGVALLLTFGSWLHLNVTDNFYHGPRWMGIWDTPNIYGMLMSVGVVLVIGMAVQMWKAEGGTRKDENGKEMRIAHGGWRNSLGQWKLIILLVLTFMMGMGLLFSYSRGPWLGTLVGLLYLAKFYGKFKWRYILPGIVIVAVTVCCFWNTPRTSPWYFQRLDLGRGSAQNRVVAWKAGFDIMYAHPLGVGWNNTVTTYQEIYSPPGDSAFAITTNDYLMLGTQLGIPALLCFITYVVLCFGARNWWRKKSPPTEDYGFTTSDPKLRTPHSALRTKLACRAAALSLLVAFWFDSGLFKLATASIFWILLELGREDLPQQNVIENNPVLPANSVL